MSRATTGWPSSAKKAAVTSPTQPAPTTPSGSLSIAGSLIMPARLQALRDREHRLVGEAVEKSVDDPVGAAVLFERVHVQVRPVDEKPVFASLDRLRVARPVEGRFVCPIRLLDVPILSPGLAV